MNTVRNGMYVGRKCKNVHLVQLYYCAAEIVGDLLLDVLLFEEDPT